MFMVIVQVQHNFYMLTHWVEKQNKTTQYILDTSEPQAFAFTAGINRLDVEM